MPMFQGFHTSQVVQDFSHQQYHVGGGRKILRSLSDMVNITIILQSFIHPFGG